MCGSKQNLTCYRNVIQTSGKDALTENDAWLLWAPWSTPFLLMADKFGDGLALPVTARRAHFNVNFKQDTECGIWIQN